MYATTISHETRDSTRHSRPSRALPLGAAGHTGAAATAAARSQRLLVEWSLLQCPDRKKGRDR